MYSEVMNLLAERLGFDIETIGPRAVEAVVQRSMERAGFSDAAEYARVLARDSEMWNRLVDRVVIPETWFFRDHAPYELAAELARKHVSGGASRGAPRALRILSCPCSTGEEPYSLAMTMLDAGVPEESFHVDAVDVCRRSIETARAGMYRKRSFRNDPRGHRDAHFERVDAEGHWRVKHAVSSRVRFQFGNLVAPGFLGDEAPYDVVFCRNLLIYLHLEARLVAMAALRRLVADEGVLVLGHAEPIFARDHGFQPSGPAAAFALVKSGAAPRKSMATQEIARSSAGTGVRAPIPRPATNFAGASAPIAPVRPASAAAKQGPLAEQKFKLELARKLGDAGQLEAALEACREHLARVPDSAEGYFLLGVLHDARGEFELAARDFKKVLYLDPTHREALLHLALKREALGDVSGAALLRARAQRTPNAEATE